MYVYNIYYILPCSSSAGAFLLLRLLFGLLVLFFSSSQAFTDFDSHFLFVYYPHNRKMLIEVLKAFAYSPATAPKMNSIGSEAAVATPPG
jgi:hypothetical protein